MKFFWSIVGFMTIVVSTSGFAQGSRDQGQTDQRPNPERIERFKKMRLVETLKLNEEEAIRFFAKQSAHEDKMKELMESRNKALDKIQDIVQDKGDRKDMSKLTDDVLDVDQKIFAERQRYQNEIRTSLTPEQFGKFLVFERNFEHHMREAVKDMIQDRRHGNRNW